MAGLESSTYTDKVTVPISTATSPSGPVKISSKTDRVYTPASGPDSSVSISESGKKIFSIVRDNMNEVVVWNPWKEDAAGMSDFSPKDGYKQMICVEAGAVKGWVELGAGEDVGRRTDYLGIELTNRAIYLILGAIRVEIGMRRGTFVY